MVRLRGIAIQLYPARLDHAAVCGVGLRFHPDVAVQLDPPQALPQFPLAWPESVLLEALLFQAR
jgi:hypothetical protein